MQNDKKLDFNLLVIEDSTTGLKEIIVSALSEKGYRLTTYSDHLGALTKLGELKPDLIILGEGLLIDSFKICYQLRQAVDVPILIIGSIPRATGWVKAVKSGADCYLEKPVNCLELVARTGAILRRYEWALGYE